MTTQEITTFFDRWGYVRVPGAFDRDASRQMQAWLWERMREVHGIDPQDQATWNVAWPGMHITEKKSGLLPAKMATAAYRAVADALLGPGAWALMKDWSGALISFPPPDAAPWTVARDGWHWDTEVMAHRNGPQGLFTFAVFSDIEPQGGGTLLLAGSHHLLNRYYDNLTPAEQAAKRKSHRLRFPKSSPYLAALTGNAPDAEDRIARFMAQPTEIDGVLVQVVEVTGQPGDAFVCHPSLYHAVSANCRAVPRLMRITAARKSQAGQK